jgi:hypothetical protein
MKVIGRFIRSHWLMMIAFVGILLLAWHQYRTHFGWVLADSFDQAKNGPRIIIREFLDPILPDEDGMYRFEYWQGHIMREAFTFASDSFRANSARLKLEPDGSYSARLKYGGNEREIAVWHGAWSRSQ